MATKGICVRCNELKNGRNSPTAGGFICPACWREHHAKRKTCGCCKRPDMVINACPDDVDHCEACYKREVNSAICFYCSKKRPTHARDDEDHPVCLVCYEACFKALEKCMYCGEATVPAYRGPNQEGICRPCYHREVNHAECAVCGNDLPIAARMPRTMKPLCTHHCHLAKAS